MSSTTPADVGAETTELLQGLIRNACVNDGTVESGHEVRNTDLLRSYLETSTSAIEEYEPQPGRTSLVARIEGSDPTAPTLCLMGHTDVVPVTAEGWDRDPFGGELVDGEVWGRGAIDMLNLTSSMAVAFRRLAVEGWKPKGTLIYLAVADEEAAGTHGAEWLAENRYDAIRSDYVLSESGGILQPSDGGRTVTLTTGEKGVAWRRLRVHGTPGHGSMPYGADNALVKAAAVVGRLAAYRPETRITDTWRAYAGSLDLPADIRADLIDPDRALDSVGRIDDLRLAKLAHACTHMTFSPNVVHGGVKTNVIPDVVDIDVDIRVLPGDRPADVTRNIAAALGELGEGVEVTTLHESNPTSSEFDTLLRQVLEKVTRQTYPDAALVPRMTTGGTDLRFFREKGAVGYGFGLFSPGFTASDFASRFHGHNERVDVESLRLTTEMWIQVVKELLG
jgi:acetylornithine deacetylase/succinyl-diaminopimelate desuccinylase-like protein